MYADSIFLNEDLIHKNLNIKLLQHSMTTVWIDEIVFSSIWTDLNPPKENKKSRKNFFLNRS